MYYEINVSLNGRHFFATAPRSITYHELAKEMVKLFIEKFPVEEGYAVSCSVNPEVSRQFFDSSGRYGHSNLDEAFENHLKKS